MEHAHLMRVANAMFNVPEFDARDLLARWIHEVIDLDWDDSQQPSEMSKEEWTDWAHPIIQALHRAPNVRGAIHLIWGLNHIYSNMTTWGEAQALVYGVQRAYYIEIGPKEYG